MLSQRLALTLLSCFLFLSCQNRESQNQRKIGPISQEEFNWAMQQIKAHYVEDVPDGKLMEGAIQGLLNSLDDFSGYLDGHNLQSVLEKTKGEYGGIGIEIIFKDGVIRVISPIDYTPAYHAGLEPGDIITHVDDKAIKDMEPKDVVDRIQGKPGTKLKLTVFKPRLSKIVPIPLERAIITVIPVSYRLFGDIGYLRVSVFNEQLNHELKKALQELNKKEVKGVILDIRNNPGGTLDQAVAACECFKDTGVVVRIKSRDGSLTKDIAAHGKDLLDGKPIVVMINKGSASASEILAGFLQDHKRALLIGSPTFGKGSVQQVIEMPDKKGAIKLTIAHFYTPNHHQIQKKGVKPDIEVNEPEVVDLKESHMINIHNIDKDPLFKRSLDLVRGLATFSSRKGS